MSDVNVISGNRPGLGRIIEIDPRDHDHLMAGALHVAGAVEVALTPQQEKFLASGKRTHNPAVGGQPVWDQGQTSRCVSFATNRWLIASPIRNRVWGDTGKTAVPAGDLNADLTTFYETVQAADGFPMPHEGTTVRAAMQVLQGAGYIKGEYTWGFDAPSVARHILLWGPVIAGTDWTQSMFNPIDMGKLGKFVQVAPGGIYDVAGGHSYLIYGVNLKGRCPDGSTGWVEFINSWGSDWGAMGTARMSLKDLGILANNQGEFATAQEIKVKL